MIPTDNSETSSDCRVICTLQDHLDDVFQVSTGLKAPATLASRKGKRTRSMAAHHIQEFERLSANEKAEFLDSLLDLVSGTLTVDEAQATLKKLSTVGRVGKLLERIEGQVNRFEQTRKVQFVEEALRLSLDKIELIHSLLAKELLFSDDRKFGYLLISSAIIDEMRGILSSSLKKLEKGLPTLPVVAAREDR